MPQVALLQLDTTWDCAGSDSGGDPESKGQPEINEVLVQRAVGMIENLPDIVDWAILPELWPVGAFNTNGFIPGAIELRAAAVSHPLISRLSDAARARGIWLHAGSLVEKAGDEYFNTSLLFDDAGEIAASYRKIHLFGFGAGEAQILSAGQDVVVVDTPLGRMGLSTCYDLRFPELYRLQREQGAEVFAVPTGWPDLRIHAWRTLATARAVENQAWIVGCNGVSSGGRPDIGGNSIVASPSGAVSAVGSGDQEQVLIADIDVEQVAEARRSFPVDSDRKF